MTDTRDIGDRHLRAADGLKDSADAKPASVRIIVADEWASSRAGQLLVSCLVNLLARQAGIVEHVEIVATETPLVISLPSGATHLRFPQCLEDLGRWSVNKRVTVSVTPNSSLCDYSIVIGHVGGSTFLSGTVYVVVGDGWNAWIGEPSHAPADLTPRSENPLGPFLAAALASGEIFKRSRGLLRGSYLTANGFSLWSGDASVNWGDLVNGPELAGHTLPPTHLVGAGAVGNAFAYVVTYSQFRDAYVVAIDDDCYDSTNLNRCLAAGWADIGQPKVDALAHLLISANLGAFPYPHTVNDYIIDQRSGLRPDAAQEANELDFKIVLSCVDKGVSRQHVQGLHPHLLAGASTLDLRAQSNLYGTWPGAACLGCYNRAERDGDKLRALEMKVRGLPTDKRREFFLANGLDTDAIEKYLADPQCGTVGETALRDFAIKPPQDFSAGFVSLTAGLLLASALFRQLFFSGAPDRADMTTLNFLTGGFMDSGLSADPGCELNCGRHRAVAKQI